MRRLYWVATLAERDAEPSLIGPYTLTDAWHARRDYGSSVPACVVHAHDTEAAWHEGRRILMARRGQDAAPRLPLTD